MTGSDASAGLHASTAKATPETHWRAANDAVGLFLVPRCLSSHFVSLPRSKCLSVSSTPAELIEQSLGLSAATPTHKSNVQLQLQQQKEKASNCLKFGANQARSCPNCTTRTEASSAGETATCCSNKWASDMQFHKSQMLLLLLQQQGLKIAACHRQQQQQQAGEMSATATSMWQ